MQQNYFNKLFKFHRSIVFISILIIVFINIVFYNSVSSKELPSDIDASKFKFEDKEKAILDGSPKSPSIDKKQLKKPQEAPTNAKDFKFFLYKVRIIGSTVLKSQDIKKIYNSYLYKEISLSDAYDFAAKITELYNKQGYFLSLAYIPEQKINENKGIVQIKVIEGYIHNIGLPKETHKYNKKILKHLKGLLYLKPIKANDLESALLRLNDLFGYQFKGTLVSIHDSQPNAVKLLLSATKVKDHGRININNFGSKSIGPHKIRLTYNKSLTPFDQVKFAAENSIIGSLKKFNYFNLGNDFIINKYVGLNVLGEFTKTIPVGILRQAEIKSVSNGFYVTLNYKLIRQRDYNLYFKSIFNLQNSYNYILNQIFSKDKIRTIKLNLNYDININNKSNNIIDFTFTKGLKILNSSKKGELNISRAAADPDFSKFEVNFSHLRRLINNIFLLFSINGQYANKIMFSKEEFGYGGQALGRAFDSSEISGDNGLAGLLEISYNYNLNIIQDMITTSYIYYDLGSVWHKDPTRTPNKKTAASYGLGIRAKVKDFNFHFGLAWPLHRNISNPIYDQRFKGPRILFECFLDF